MKHRLSLPDLWKLTFESLRYEYEILKKKAISREDFAREIYSIVFYNDDKYNKQKYHQNSDKF